MTEARARTPVPGLVTIVGFLVAVEVASGILQGYYTPIITDISRHLNISDADFNWFEAGQLVLGALSVPLLARLGDLWGHRNVLLLATGVTALGSWILVIAPSFTTFLIGWSLQAGHMIWLPMEVAIVYQRTRGTGRQEVLTRRSAAVLVGFLELSVIIGALSAGALVERVSMHTLLAIPAIVVTVVLGIIWFGVRDSGGESEGSIDWGGLGLITLAIGLLMAGLIAVRVQGAGSLLGWALVVAGCAAVVPFWRYEARHAEPLVDVHLFAQPRQWPIQITAFLFGMAVLGSQIPLSTFARTDPGLMGYGLGADAGGVSVLIGLYVVSLALGAFTVPLWARWLGLRGALVAGCLLVALGYGLWLPFHGSMTSGLINMCIAGIGSGALVASLPAAAAAAAPPHRTGIATGMTNGIKTIGGAIASSVFAIALSSTGDLEGPQVGHAPLSGYLVVWGVCAAAGLLAALALRAVPARTFADPS